MPGSTWFMFLVWVLGTGLCFLALQQALPESDRNSNKVANLAAAALWPVTLFFLKRKLKRWISLKENRA